jgi:hypothetical protein
LPKIPPGSYQKISIMAAEDKWDVSSLIGALAIHHNNVTAGGIKLGNMDKARLRVADAL